MWTRDCESSQGEGEALWLRWRGIEVNKNISNNLIKKSILSSQPILPSVVMLPFLCPYLSKHQNNNIKPLNVMKVIVNRSLTKNSNKSINGVNDFNVGQQPYSIVGHMGK